MREIINLYVAEGFSKLHTGGGYTNSRITYRDLKEVCEFIIFKIKTQNFLDLAMNENLLAFRNKQASQQAAATSKPTLLKGGRQQGGGGVMIPASNLRNSAPARKSSIGKRRVNFNLTEDSLDSPASKLSAAVKDGGSDVQTTQQSSSSASVSFS